MSQPNQQLREHNCFYCGESLGFFVERQHPLDHCGKSECSREARNAYEYERQEHMERAAEDFDDQHGW